MIFRSLRKAASNAIFAKNKTILLMKWTAFMLLAGCLQVAASGKAQEVNLSLKNASLKSVFRDIGKQTGYSFFYNAKLLKETEPVDVNIKDATLEQALRQILKDMPLSFAVVNKTVVVKFEEPREEAAPPPATISGKVVDEEGMPLGGASITVKGTDIGLSASPDGNFSFVVPKLPAVLQFSFVGYAPTSFTVKAAGNYTITMKPAEEKDSMENVVVTGYQNIRKESFTGTAVTVSGEDLKMVNPQNMLRSLQVFDPSFRVAENSLFGSNPNRLPDITVRGSTALPSGNTDVISRNNLAGAANLPTFILDGYEVSLQKIYDLDINRVKSITLLKDAAATAVYGSRAANGVVVITTHPPKAGKLQVSYNYELNVTTPDLTQYDILDAERKLEYERLAGVYDAQKNTAVGQDYLDQLYYNKKELVVGGVNTYWLSQPLRTTFGQKHSLYLEGGDRAFRYGLEMRYQTLPGVMKGSTRDRLSTGLNLSYNVGSKFMFRNQLTVTHMKATESPFGNFSDYARMNPYYPKTDSSGRVIQVIDNWTEREGGGGAVREIPVLNPMYNATLGSFNESDYIEMIDALTAEWNILHGLRMRGVFSLNKTKSTSDNFVSPFANQYYNYGTDQLDERGSYTYGNNDETSFDGNLSLLYNRQLGDHFFNAMLGTNVRTYLSRYREVNAIGFTNDRFRDLGFAAGYRENAKPYSRLVRERIAGAFVTLNYSMRNKYLLDFTYRRDGSSKFGRDRKVAPFSALGLGWNMHLEDFMDGSVFSRMKLRASTGTTGSVQFDPYMSHPTYNYYTGNWYSTGVGATVNNYGNSALQWQKTRNYDFGAEIGFLNDRIVIMPRYYEKLTRGLVADVSLPPSSGFTYYKDNVGDMLNKGYELNIQAGVIRSNTWNVSLMANFVRNTNTILRISNSLKAYNDKVQELQDDPEYKGAPLLRYQEGQSLDAIYAVRSLGIDPENGRELYVKRDGTLTYDWDPRDVVPVGNSAPKAEGFFNLNTAYKQWTMNLVVYSRFGGEQYNQTIVDRVENSDPRFNVDSRVFEEKWRERGDYTFYKNIADLGNTDVTSRFIQKDQVVDIQSVYLSYDLNKAFISKAGMSSLRLAFTMNDIGRWSSIRQERGIDYPYARSFLFSIQAGF